MKLSLLEKHKPTDTKDIVGNGTLIKNLKEHIKNNKGPVLISGPVGIGRTLSVELIIKELGSEGLWYDATDLDSKSIDLLDLNSLSLFKKNTKKVYVIDNADGFPESVNKSLSKKLKTATHCIVIICNDPYPLKEIEKICTHFKFIRPSKIQIKKFLFDKKIFKESTDPGKNERIHEKIEDLILETNNDIRFLLNTLGLKIIESDKDQTVKNIFDATSVLFSSHETNEKKINAYYFDTYMVPQMVHANYLNTKKQKIDEDDVESAECIANSDIFGNRQLTSFQGFTLIKATRKQKLGFPKYPSHPYKPKSTFGIDRLDVISYLIPILINKITSNDFEAARELLNYYSIPKDQIYDLFKLWLGPINETDISTSTKTTFTKYLNSTQKINTEITSDLKINTKTEKVLSLLTEFQKMNIIDFFTSY